MLSSGFNLVTTVIGFLISSTFMVFICFRFLCGRARDVTVPSDFQPDIEQLEDSEHTITGLDPVLLTAIPAVKYTHEDFSSRDDTQCSICLGEYEEKEMLRILPSCNHSFHLTCIDMWLQKQSTCPICRLPLTETLESKVFGIEVVSNLQTSDVDYHQLSFINRQSSQHIGYNPEIRELTR